MKVLLSCNISRSIWLLLVIMHWVDSEAEVLDDIHGMRSHVLLQVGRAAITMFSGLGHAHFVWESVSSVAWVRTSGPVLDVLGDSRMISGIKALRECLANIHTPWIY